MHTDIRITPRNLGGICLDGYCPRCFKYLLIQKFHPPFNHFGAAIFSDMQKSQEAVIGFYLDRDGCLPKEFSPFSDCSSRADFPRHWSKFSYTHESGVVLYGAPDEIFHRKDGTLCVVDLKTAHCKEGKDRFRGQYEVQVVGYAAIAEGLGLGEVTLGGLLYWEAQLEQVQKDASSHYSGGMLKVPFVPKAVEIAIDYTILVPLIKELKQVWNSTTIPEGRDRCDDCKKLDILFAIEEDFKQQDQRRRHYFADVKSVQWEISRRKFLREQRQYSIWAEFRREGDAIFSNDGLVANWEYLD